MNCSNCGAPLKENAAFCAVCGKEVALNNTGVHTKRDVIDNKSSNKGAKTVIIIICSVLAVCMTVLGIYFILGFIGVREASQDVKICVECMEEFRGSGDFCEDCAEINKNAKECKMCLEKHNTEAFLCDACIKNVDENYYSGRYFCGVCEEIIEKEEITYVDDFGYVFCSDCDDDYTCDECEDEFKYTEIEYDDGKDIYCWRCYGKMLVSTCKACFKDILDRDEYKKFDGKYYCMECYRNLSLGTCEECGKDIKVSDNYYGDKDNYCCEECYAGTCKICDAILMGSKYKKIDGRYYCYECYGGKGYIGDCDDCGDKIYDRSNYKEADGRYYCEDCGANESAKCTYCGTGIEAGSIYSLEGKHCCEECYYENK